MSVDDAAHAAPVGSVWSRESGSSRVLVVVGLGMTLGRSPFVEYITLDASRGYRFQVGTRNFFAKSHLLLNYERVA